MRRRAAGASFDWRNENMGQSYTVAVTDYGFPNLEPERSVLEPLGCKIVTGQCRTAEEVAELTKDADAVLTQFAPVTAPAIERMRRCRMIVRYGIGVDNVDLEAAARRGIAVVNVPDYGVQEVADHTLGLILAVVRKIPQVVQQVKRGRWDIAPLPPIFGLDGKTLGLGGFGNIARAVAKRAQSFNLQVIAHDPYAPDAWFEQWNVERVGWHELLARSDVLSLHLPLVEETRHLLNREAFARMKPTAYLINTSRGGVVETEALLEALQLGRIAGAALDVLEEEPVPADHPLLSLDHCLVTSHYAWYSEESMSRLQLYAALEIKRLMTGDQPKHIVNGVVPQPFL
jgi:D-3-phosphoglycerate dehydrogenase